MNQSSSTLRSSMSVLHVFRSPKGGLFRHVCDLVNAQRAMGYCVGILCHAGPVDREAEQRLEQLSDICQLGVHRLAVRRTPALSDLLVARYMWGHFRQDGVDILHGHGAKGGAIARLMAHQVGAKAVYTPHGGTLHFKPGTLAGTVYLGIEKLLRGRTDGIIFESRYAQDVYRSNVGIDFFDSKVIYNGLHEEEFELVEPKPEAADFLFLGELRQLKGIESLVLACERLAKDQDFTLAIAGSGPDEAQLRAMILQRGLGDKVCLLGPVHSAREAFSQGKCLLVPSLAESMPYVVLEAIAAGLPVIASGVGGVPEIFKGREELLVEPGNDRALAQRMSHVLDADERFLSATKELRRRLFDHFCVEKMAKETVDFYQRVLEASPRKVFSLV